MSLKDIFLLKRKKEIIRKVAEGEMSSKEALEIFSKSTKNLD